MMPLCGDLDPIICAHLQHLECRMPRRINSLWALKAAEGELQTQKAVELGGQYERLHEVLQESSAI